MRLLERAGVRTRVLEARDRIGGRIHTLHDARIAHPIELGAEFVHGSPEELREILDEAKLLAYAVEGERWRSRGGRLTRLHHFWRRLHNVMRHFDAKEDISFAEFLAARPGGRSAADARRLALTFVEGFHAADATRISTQWVAQGGPTEDAEERRITRIADGYDRVVEWLAGDLTDRIVTRAVVTRIEWEPGSVELTIKGPDTTTTLSAGAAIVTVPLGVLLAHVQEEGAITFEPALPILESTRDQLAMGAVSRVTLLFDDFWWTEQPHNASRCLTFVHGEEGDIPIWWSLYPAQVPAMVGWVGGPRALRLAGLSLPETEDRATRSLAANFGVPRRRMASHVVASWTHDWTRDPFARGAYSYPLVGGADWTTRLARPIDRTIWLAGEAVAADASGSTGTVDSALASGRRAARSVLRVFK